MTNLWLKFKIWTKAILFSLVLIYIFWFMLRNSGKTATLWYFFFRPETTASLLVLVFGAFAVGVIGTLLVRTTLRTISQIREARQRGQSQRLEREVADMKAKAAKLQTVDHSRQNSLEDPL